jgi:hypothetical protein
MTEQHEFFSFDIGGNEICFGEMSYDFPEAILRIGIVKILFPRGDGRKRPQNKYFGFFIKNGGKWILKMGHFLSLGIILIVERNKS